MNKVDIKIYFFYDIINLGGFMFSKNNLKYILILAIGFFWCSSLYLTQEQCLIKYASANFVNMAELLFGSLSMALGILTFALLYRKNRSIKKFYIIFMILSIITMITFFATKNVYLMSVCLSLTCFLGTAGFGAGYHFSLLASNVYREYRGRVFAIGYGLGSFGTYLLILLPSDFYTSIKSLIIYIPMVLFNLFLILKTTDLLQIREEKYMGGFKDYFVRISIIVLAMAILSALSTDAIAFHTINVVGGYGSTRIYYCLGLLAAGFLVDKKNNLFEILTIVSFIFSLLAIILLKEKYSISLIASLSYLLVGFFVLFRTMSFVNMVDNKKSIVWASAFGLMYSRIIEGLIVLFEDNLIKHYTFLIIVIMVLLSLLIILYFFLYFESNKMTENDVVRNISIKYKLGAQEEKVLNLLIQDLSNQEMADRLYVSINTIRNHVANIYKKTGMKKKELKEKCFYRTN